MTILRTAIRLAAGAAIRGSALARPTIAQNRVYDSRIGDFAPESAIEDALPTVILLTDKDEGDQLSEQNGGPPFRRMIDLVIEIGMISTVQDAETGEYVLMYPDTEPRLEASLDVLETQILHHLAYNLDDDFAVLLRGFTRPVKYDCHRQVMDAGGVKIAARVLTLTMDAGDDKVLLYPAGEVPAGLNALPEPLKSVALALDPASEGGIIVAQIAAALRPFVAGPLVGVNFKIDAGDNENGADAMDVSVEIQNAGSVPQTVAASANVEIDYSKGTFQHLILAANVSSLSIVGWPRIGKTGRLILQITQTGNYAIDGWPAGTAWVGGQEPNVTLGAGARDIFVFTTATNGAEIYANVVGQDYRT